MKTIKVPTSEQVSPESQVLFEILKKRAGKVANLYATMGYSANALKGFMDLDEDLSKGVFTAKDREAIALAVSEVNGCAYCLAGHTLLAIKRGFTKEETMVIRKGIARDLKLNAALQLAQSITRNFGKGDPKLLENFYSAGFDEGALMELIGLITVRIYTNYVFAMTQIPIDFPAAEPIS